MMDYRNNPLHKFVFGYLIDVSNAVLVQSDPVKAKESLKTYVSFYKKLPEDYRLKLNLPLPLPYKIDYEFLMNLYQTETKEEKTSAIQKWFRGK